MLLEDEHGQVNLIVPKDVYERHRGIVRAEPIVLVRGRYERVERNRNVLVSELESLSPPARVAATPSRLRAPARSISVIAERVAALVETRRGTTGSTQLRASSTST